jgi:hypothetical protein
MKIKLERKLTTCPDKLACATCHTGFAAGRLRALLYSDRGLVLGDICPACLKLEAADIRRLLRKESNRLMSHPKGSYSQTISLHRQALELLETSEEEVQFPMLYQRLIKQFQIFSQESQELEAAKFNLSSRSLSQRARLERMFQLDDQ